MQLRLALSVPKFTGSGFNQTTSAILTGVTIAGAFSTVIFNSTTARTRFTEAFQTFAKLFSDTPIYSGVEKIAGTFKDWGTTIVAKKDEFKQWVYDYLNPSGLKSGGVELYKKLYEWAEIVYDWFANKFIKFISNIPEMVKRWKQLRLSLFKWGTFLGGGGGAAIWGMLGSGDNWDKFGELLGNPEFGDLIDKFSTLLDQNGDAFGAMTEEEAKEMLQAILDDPNEAKGLVDELLEEQKQKNEEKEKELKDKGEEQKEQEQLEKDKILEKFKNSGGGSPKDPTEAFGNMVSKTLENLTKANGWTKDIQTLAVEEMKKYIETLKGDVAKNARKADVKKKFLEAIEGNELAFTYSLAEAAKTAYDLIQDKPIKYPELAKMFAKVLETKYTEVSTEEGGEGVNIEQHIPMSPLKK